MSDQNLSVVRVLTSESREKILEKGGSEAWTMSAKKAQKLEYVVCIQNRATEWAGVVVQPYAAFIVGKVKEVRPSTAKGFEKRWMLAFSEFAEVNIPDAWPGHRNPVSFTNFEGLNLKLEDLQFKQMPTIDPPSAVQVAAKSLSIAEAKQGLAATFGVSPADIEITIRG